MIDYLANKKIHTSVHFKPLYKYGPIKQDREYPVCETEWTKLISLPCHNAMKEEDIDYVIYWVNEYFKNIDKSAGTKWENIDRDRADHRFRTVHPFLSDEGNLIFKYGSPLLSIDKTNKLVWMNDDYVHHHSIEKDSDNHLWVPVHFYPYKIVF